MRLSRISLNSFHEGNRWTLSISSIVFFQVLSGVPRRNRAAQAIFTYSVLKRVGATRNTFSALVDHSWCSRTLLPQYSLSFSGCSSCTRGGVMRRRSGLPRVEVSASGSAFRRLFSRSSLASSFSYCSSWFSSRAIRSLSASVSRTPGVPPALLGRTRVSSGVVLLAVSIVRSVMTVSTRQQVGFDYPGPL